MNIFPNEIFWLRGGGALLSSGNEEVGLLEATYIC